MKRLLACVLLLALFAPVPASAQIATNLHVETTGNDANDCLTAATACETLQGVFAKCPTAEVCNGADDNCNGEIDEDFPTLGTACDGPDSDLCLDDTMICAASVTLRRP